MSLLRRASARLAALFRRDALDADFEDEAAAHISLAVDEYVRRGWPAAEAERLARLRFGSITAAKEAHRDTRALPWIERWFFDVRQSLRNLCRDWTFTLPSIAMLALALGLNATVFTVMDAMLFRGFPYVHENRRLVYLQERSRPGECCLSYADFEDWRTQATAFEGLAFVGGQAIALRDGSGPAIDTRAITVSASGSTSTCSASATLAKCAASLSEGIRRRSKRWQRDSTVTGTLSTSVVANRNFTCSGGSSSVFSKALKAFLESM